MLSDNPELDMDDNIRVDEAYLAKELEILEHIRERYRKNDCHGCTYFYLIFLHFIWIYLMKYLCLSPYH